MVGTILPLLKGFMYECSAGGWGKDNATEGSSEKSIKGGCRAHLFSQIHLGSKT